MAVGPERFSAVVSDHTGNTRKSQKLICNTWQHILNFLDCCHHMSNTVKDLVQLDMFKKVHPQSICHRHLFNG